MECRLREIADCEPLEGTLRGGVPFCVSNEKEGCPTRRAEDWRDRGEKDKLSLEAFVERRRDFVGVEGRNRVGEERGSRTGEGEVERHREGEADRCGVAEREKT